MLRRLGLPYDEARTSEELRREAESGFQGAELMVDAILGSGFRPPVAGLYAEAITAINQSGLPVLAVDIPSGEDSDSFKLRQARLAEVCRADAIATFTAPRPAHVFGNLTTGPVRVAPIGSPAAAIQSELKLEAITAPDVAGLLAPRAVDANKGRFGHALIIGGSRGKSGAAALAGLAALRAGAGLSTVATAESALPTVAAHACEVMTEPLAETGAGSIAPQALEDARFTAIVEGKNALAVGPGISRHPETVKFVRAMIARYQHLPLVLDADGLNAFQGAAAELDGRGRTLVLTPHPGEMARLAGAASAAEVQRDRLGIARRFAGEHQLVLVLKGWRTLVALPDGTVWVNLTGNPGMASGGTGDVLTGILAGFLAQFPDQVIPAVCAAVYLHGLAGDVAREVFGEHSMIAGDLLACLPEAFRRARHWASEKLVRLGSA